MSSKLIKTIGLLDQLPQWAFLPVQSAPRLLKLPSILSTSSKHTFAGHFCAKGGMATGAAHRIRACLDKRPEPGLAEGCSQASWVRPTPVRRNGRERQGADRPQLAECLRRLRRGRHLGGLEARPAGTFSPTLCRSPTGCVLPGVYIELLQPRGRVRRLDDGQRHVRDVRACRRDGTSDLIRERTRQALPQPEPEAARRRRKPKLTEAQIKERSTRWWTRRSSPSVESPSCTVSREPQFTGSSIKRPEPKRQN